MFSSPNSKVRTLARAAAALGDAARLAALLDVDLAQVEDWLAGRVEIPPEAFTAALDVVAAGPFVRWPPSDDAQWAQRQQAHADYLQAIADRIKQSAVRAQRIADRAQRTANRSIALAQVQRALQSAKSEQEDLVG